MKNYSEKILALMSTKSLGEIYIKAYAGWYQEAQEERPYQGKLSRLENQLEIITDMLNARPLNEKKEILCTMQSLLKNARVGNCPWEYDILANMLQHFGSKIFD